MKVQKIFWIWQFCTWKISLVGIVSRQGRSNTVCDWHFWKQVWPFCFSHGQCTSHNEKEFLQWKQLSKANSIVHVIRSHPWYGWAKDIFSSSVSPWHQSQIPTFCLRKLHPTKPTCQGLRSNSNRTFAQGIPLVLPFNVNILTRNDYIRYVRDLTNEVRTKIKWFFWVTYGNRIHFRSAMNLPSLVKQPGWYEVGWAMGASPKRNRS